MDISAPDRLCLSLGDVIACVEGTGGLAIDGMLSEFRVPSGDPSLTIRLAPVKPEALPLVGEDFFRSYYSDGQRLCVAMKGAAGVPTAVFTYEGTGGVYDLRFQNSRRKDLTPWLSLLPMHRLLYPFGVIMLHASRVVWKDGAILFIGNSGIGKTTQARLWQRAGALLAGNDRTLLRKTDAWQTYGYFEDGDAPVCDPARVPLKAVVCLSQAKEDWVERLSPSAAIRNLMNQAFVLHWDAGMRGRILEEFLELVQEVPVYHQQCTPTLGAVECLRGELEQCGVMECASLTE